MPLLNQKHFWQMRAEAAFRYVSEHGLIQRGGFVVFHDNSVNGWMKELRDPTGWVLGCIAVSMTENKQYQAVGGNDYDGAKQWQELTC